MNADALQCFGLGVRERQRETEWTRKGIRNIYYRIKIIASIFDNQTIILTIFHDEKKKKIPRTEPNAWKHSVLNASRTPSNECAAHIKVYRLNVNENFNYFGMPNCAISLHGLTFIRIHASPSLLPDTNNSTLWLRKIAENNYGQFLFHGLRLIEIVSSFSLLKCRLTVGSHSLSNALKYLLLFPFTLHFSLFVFAGTIKSDRSSFGVYAIILFDTD